MSKQWKILSAVYLAINTLFLMPAVQYSVRLRSMEEILRGPVYTIPYYGEIMEWYAHMQLTGTHWGLALFFVIFCFLTIDFKKLHNRVLMGALVCLVVINIFFNWRIVFLYTPFL